MATVEGVSSASNVAITGHDREEALVAVVSTDGQLSTSGSSSPGSWGEWKAVAGNMHASTAPVFVTENRTTHLFTRGADNLLYHFTKLSTADWVAAPLPGAARPVNGRISAAASSGGTPTAPKIIHLVYTDAIDNAKYLRIENGIITHQQNFEGSKEVVVGTDGAERVMLAFRTETSVTFTFANKSDNWNFRRAGSITYRDGWESWDLSELVWFPPRQMFSTIAISVVPTSTSNLIFHRSKVEQIQILPIQSSAVFSSTVNPFPLLVRRYNNRHRRPPRASLVNYRNKLIAAWRNPAGEIQYARWDNADIQTPWIEKEGNKLCAQSIYRPVLASLNKSLIEPERNLPNYGNDLFLAVSNNTVKALNFSRTVLKTRTKGQFLLMQMDANSTCGNADDPAPAYRIDLNAEERPFITELGFNVWLFPHWFMKGFYKKAAARICNNRIRGQPCSTAKMPAIVTRLSGLYFCQGVFFNISHDAVDIYQELGHYMAIAMGCINNGSGPTQADADRCGISLSRLQEGYEIFSEREHSCPRTPPRCIGFTGYSDNYDVTGREHSFIYTAMFYIDRPQQIREFIQEDLAAGDDLLQRKYDWVKRNIFRGVEFW